MGLTYEDLHDGDAAPWVQRMDVAHGTGRAVGQITHIAYAKHAGGETRIHEHKFETHDGRLPYLVADSGSGQKVTIERPAKDLHAFGRALDCKLKNGERVILGGLFVATDDTGQVVMLASPFEVDLQIGRAVV